jgi:protein O-mannosyl-transferase
MVRSPQNVSANSPDGHQRVPIRLSAILFVVFALAASAIYYPGLKAPFVLDSIRLQMLAEIDHQVGLRDFIGLGANRLVSMLSFYLSYAVGGMDPYYFRIFNLLALSATSVAVVAVLSLLITITDRQSSSSERKLVAIGIGCLFLSHPVNTSVVLYVWQRQALLASLFYCSAFVAYLATRTGVFRYTKTGYLICFCLFACAILSKQNAITLPLVIVLAEAGFFKQDKKSLIATVALILGLAGGAFLLKTLFEWLFFGLGASTHILGTMEQFRSLSQLSPAEILFTFSRVVFSHYLLMIVAPLPSNIKVLDAVVISRSLVDPPSTLFAVLGIALLVVGSLVFLKKRPLTAFGILFFLINVAPEPLLEPQFLFMGHRANLAMFGLCLVAADGLLVLIGWAKKIIDPVKLPIRMAVLLVLPIVWLGMVTHLRAEIWSNPLFFWRDTVRGLPPAGPNVERANYFIALGSLGREMKKLGRFKEAIDLFGRALQIWPGSDRAWLNLADTLAVTGKIPEAIECYERALKLQPNDAAVHFNLAVTFLEAGRRTDAIKHLRMAVEIKPRFAKALYRLGKILSESGEPTEGAQLIRRAVEIDPAVLKGNASDSNLRRGDRLR